MDIEDAVPERRNLLMMSMAFIVYYGAGGSIVTDELQLMAINVKFSRPLFIAVTAWVLLFWFALRFFQKAGFSVWGQVKSEISGSAVPNRLKEWARAEAERSSRDELINFNGCRIEVSHVSTSQHPWSLVCNYSAQNSAVVIRQELVPLSGLRGFMYKAYFAARAISAENAFAESLVPYLAFIAAVLAPAWSRVL